ncbi:MAG TPA: class I SAM-dependent methyltransferase [Sedimentisphaerales bacterium]|nr:class I SAM-dependent methyltransferase [Sedimentisphaerales bacterium]
MDKYLQSCGTEFWQNVFRAEADYILKELTDAENILSVGCGPAIIERALSQHGFNVTGLDISREALNQAPDSIRTVVGAVENMSFADCSFDAVIYVASLQFIDKYRQAIKQTARVLKPHGKLLAMLLNPASKFFGEKAQNSGSYVTRIKRTDPTEIATAIAEYFSVQTEYFLGIQGREIFNTVEPNLAALYVIKGKKKQ